MEDDRCYCGRNCFTRDESCRYINVQFYTYIQETLVLTGFVSNGEFNYEQSRGYTRPLSDCHNKYSRIKQNMLLKMLSPKGIDIYCIVAW